LENVDIGISWQFRIFYDHSAHCVLFWYIFSGFGVVHQEKSGNPGYEVEDGLFGRQASSDPRAGKSGSCSSATNTAATDTRDQVPFLGPILELILEPILELFLGPILEPILHTITSYNASVEKNYNAADSTARF
jgi:hypothetical protein